MPLPLRRVFEEKRRLVVPVLAGLALNAVLYAGVVYPLGARVRSTEGRARAATEQLRAAEREEADARAMALGRDRTEIALKAFYKDILPATHAQARHVTFLRLTQLADQHNLEQSRRSTDPKQEKDSTLARLQISMMLRGEYEDIRRFIYDVEAGSDFIVIDSITLQQGEEPGSPLVLRMLLSTYYRAVPDGP
ncbi:MAG TPA: type 4a pilus biogenesis protein PilO [Vicinamibacterales bacterium]|nr:type 4a pilus biogenesis protein PilO [Vicinamibacterales bacterium]